MLTKISWTEKNFYIVLSKSNTCSSVAARAVRGCRSRGSRLRFVRFAVRAGRGSYGSRFVRFAVRSCGSCGSRLRLVRFAVEVSAVRGCGSCNRLTNKAVPNSDLFQCK